MPAAVKQAEVQKTPALAGPQTPEAMAEYEAAQLAALQRAEEAALRQRQSVKNPLNVVGNAISAVVGTPFRLLENAIGGGNNDLAAPFRPNATAQDRYQSTLADISTAKLGLTQTMDSLRANQTQAMTNLLTDQSKLQTTASDRVANLFLNAAQTPNPQETAAAGMAVMMQDPIMRPVLESTGLNQRVWSPTAARELATSKDTIARIDAMDTARQSDPMKTQWLSDRIAAAKQLYPDVPVTDLASNPDVLLSPEVSQRYNDILAQRGGTVAEQTAAGRRRGAPPVTSSGGGSKKAGKPNVSGMSVEDLIKGAGL
jgi:hypothetical protein